MACVRLQVGNLLACIGDNEAEGEHLAGFNGIWSLRTTEGTENLFVPSYAGLNFEHIFDGYHGDTELLYEPRRAPMHLRQISHDTVELYQPPTPFWGLESWTTFVLVPPHLIEMHFRCIPRKRIYRYGYIGLFWASYINAPENKSMYFWGRRAGEERSRWIQWCTQYHKGESTVVHLEENQPRLRFSKNHPPMLFTSFSSLRYEKPFFFGHWKDYVLMVMFDRTQGLRFTHSPSGGGSTPDGTDTNPAWDWQLIIPRYQVGEEYGFRARVVFKHFISREELLQLFALWRED